MKPPTLWFAVQSLLLVWAIATRHWWIAAIAGVILGANLAVTIIDRRRGSR